MAASGTDLHNAGADAPAGIVIDVSTDAAFTAKLQDPLLEETAAAVPSLQVAGGSISFGENLSSRALSSVPAASEA